MKLEEIREVKNLEELKPVIYYLSDHMDAMFFLDVRAYREAILTRAKELDFSFNEVMQIAEDYQVFGYER